MEAEPRTKMSVQVSGDEEHALVIGSPFEISYVVRSVNRGWEMFAG